MSRVAKNPIEIADGVTVNFNDGCLDVKGNQNEKKSKSHFIALRTLMGSSASAGKSGVTEKLVLPSIGAFTAISHFAN